MSLSKPQEFSSTIAAFLNKHARDRKFVLVNDYPFEVLRFDDTIINPDSIVEQPACDHFYNFNGTAIIERYDSISKVSQSGVKVYMNGVACCAIDRDDDEVLVKVDITLLREM